MTVSVINITNGIERNIVFNANNGRLGVEDAHNGGFEVLGISIKNQFKLIRLFDENTDKAISFIEEFGNKVIKTK